MRKVKVGLWWEFIFGFLEPIPELLLGREEEAGQQWLRIVFGV